MQLRSRIISLFLLVAASIFFVIVGCGGGGGNGGTSTGGTTPTTPTTPPFTVPQGITVRIAKIETFNCPEVTALVSVTDNQSGAAIKNLTEQNFQVTGGTGTVLPLTGFLEQAVTEPIVFSLAMDYSLSLEDTDVTAMEDATIGFLQEFYLSTTPESWGELIKFSIPIEVMQDFTTDENLLVAAVRAPFAGRDPSIKGTALYDAIGKALEDIVAFRTGPGAPANIPSQSFAIVLTDGIDNFASQKYDSNSLIDYANTYNIKIVTIGFGANTDPAILYDLANETGGLYIPADDSGDLSSSLSTFLDSLGNYYFLTFDDPGAGQQVITVDVTTPDGLTGSDALEYQCP
jgi:hypothetical protein